MNIEIYTSHEFGLTSHYNEDINSPKIELDSFLSEFQKEIYIFIKSKTPTRFRNIATHSILTELKPKII